MDFFYLSPMERDALALSLWVAVSLPVGILTAWRLAPMAQAVFKK